MTISSSSQLESDESSGVETGLGGGFFSTFTHALHEQVTNFKTWPVVIVRSKWLRTPEILMFVTTFMLMVLFYFGYNLAAVVHEPVTVSAVLEARAPVSNFWNCSMLDGTCNPDWPTTQGDYCMHEGKSRCKVFPLRRLLPLGALPSSHLAMGLSQLVMEDRGCQTGAITCKEKDSGLDKVEETYVQGLESVNVKIRTSFYVPSQAWRSIGNNIQSLLQFRNGSIKRLVRYDQFGEKSLSARSLEYFEQRFPDVCGSDDGGANTCMGTPWGDYISLGILLEAANHSITLNERRRGFWLKFVVTYTNADKADFWSWPWGFKPKLIYAPQIEAFTGMKTADFEEHPFEKSVPEKFSIMRCLIIDSSCTGVHGMEVLTRIYGLFGNVRHVYYLHEVATKRQTPEDSQFSGVSLQDVEEALDRGGLRASLTHPDNDFRG